MPSLPQVTRSRASVSKASGLNKIELPSEWNIEEDDYDVTKTQPRDSVRAMAPLPEVGSDDECSHISDIDSDAVDIRTPPKDTSHSASPSGAGLYGIEQSRLPPQPKQLQPLKQFGKDLGRSTIGQVSPEGLSPEASTAEGGATVCQEETIDGTVDGFDDLDIVIPSPAAMIPQTMMGRSNEAQQASTPNSVRLNVYDLHSSIAGLNNLIEDTVTGGLYHVGVEVYGVEFMYAACAVDPATRHCMQAWLCGNLEISDTPSESSSGILWHSPRLHCVHSYKRTIDMGPTHLTMREIFELTLEMAEEWNNHSYSMLHKNCIHFANAFCEALGCGPIPTMFFLGPATNTEEPIVKLSELYSRVSDGVLEAANVWRSAYDRGSCKASTTEYAVIFSEGVLEGDAHGIASMREATTGPIATERSGLPCMPRSTMESKAQHPGPSEYISRMPQHQWESGPSPHGESGRPEEDLFMDDVECYNSVPRSRELHVGLDRWQS